MVKEASVDDVMKVLMASRKFEMQELWGTCSHLVARSGLSADLLAKHLPIDVVAKIEEIRAKSPLNAGGGASAPRSEKITFLGMVYLCLPERAIPKNIDFSTIFIFVLKNVLT